EVEDRQHSAVMHGIEELVPVPGGRHRPGLGLAIADDAGGDKLGIVEHRTIGMSERIAELAAFMDRAGRLGRGVARDTAREAELPEQPPHAFFGLRHARIKLAIAAIEPGAGDNARPAMAGSGDEDHVEMSRLDDAVEMGIDEIESRRRPPMTKQPRLDVLERERLLEQWIVEQIDLADGKVIGRAPPRIDLPELIRTERRVRDFRRLEAFGHRDPPTSSGHGASAMGRLIQSPAAGSGFIEPHIVLRESSRRRVWRATIRFSLVGMTQAETPASGDEMRGPPAALAASSSTSPVQRASRQIRARIAAACSPIPAVKTSASSPPSAATREPSSRPTR